MSSASLVTAVKALVLAVVVLVTAAPPAAATPYELLRRGDRGPAVASWQADLNMVTAPPLAVDGIFGPLTERATRRLQADAGLHVDGIVGPRTRRALEQQRDAGRTVPVDVFFSADVPANGCASVTSVQRRVAFPAVLRGALTELLSGPTLSEQQRLGGSLFGPRTAGLLRDVQIRDRVAYIDFDPALTTVNNITTSCNRAALAAQLDATATQFPTVDRAVYSIAGEPCRCQELLGGAPC
jgi:hypothetical protein